MIYVFFLLVPRGAVANMLVTSCLDNVCRLWCETVLPEDGLISVAHLDPSAAADSKFRTHRQRARFIQRFRHMRYVLQCKCFIDIDIEMSRKAKPNVSLRESTYLFTPTCV